MALQAVSNQEVLQRSAREVNLIWSIYYYTPRDEYAAEHGARLTRGEAQINIQRVSIQPEKHSGGH